MECMIQWTYSHTYMQVWGKWKTQASIKAGNEVHLSLSAYILPCVSVCRTGRRGVDIISGWIKNKKACLRPARCSPSWPLQIPSVFPAHLTAREPPTLKHHLQTRSFYNLIKRTQTICVELHSSLEHCVYKVFMIEQCLIHFSWQLSLIYTLEENCWCILSAFMVCDESQCL